MGSIEKIISIARSYKGQEEIVPNLSFKDKGFLAKMVAVGWFRTASWCAFFVIVVLKEAYADRPKIWAYLKKYVSGSTQTMWANFRRSKEVITGQVPKKGALAFWQEGSGTNGHTGIVVEVSEDNVHFYTEEGNTNGAGGREGYRVWENPHVTGAPHNEKGLNLLGFAYMPA